jgi:hypothetical protein
MFALDEQETFEHDRLKKPVTVPVLIEKQSYFVVDARAGAMAARGRKGRKSKRDTVLLAEFPGLERRRSESRQEVKAAFERLREFAPKDGPVWVATDEKQSYATILHEIFGERLRHGTTPATRRRDPSNPLFRINHTLAMTRDGVSRLVRRTWAAAKLRQWLAGQLAIWICYRNYVRDRTNKDHRLTPAMALGVLTEQWSVPRLLEWRVLPAA